MKAILVFFFLFVFANGYSNVTPVYIEINELLLIDSLKWELEFFSFFNIDSIDSLVIRTTGGKSKIIGGQFDTIYGLCVVDYTNTEKQVKINREGDIIELIVYYKDFYEKDSLVIGKFPGSQHRDYRYGLSITRISNDYLGFYYTYPPSIGIIINHYYSGLECYINGFLFDTSNKIIANTSFLAFEEKLTTDQNGFFSGEVGSKTYYIDNYYSKGAYYYFKKDTITFYPNTTITVNLHFIGKVMDIKENTYTNEGYLTAYPNPFRERLHFFIDIPPSLSDFHEGVLEILDNKGRVVFSKKVNRNPEKLEISLPDNSMLSPGIYYSRVRVNEWTEITGPFLIKQ